MIEDLIARTFATRNAAHVAHFRTKSFAEHVALDSFYSDLIGAVDELVECHMGQRGKIDAVQHVPVPTGEIIAVLESDLDWIAKNRDALAEGSQSLANLVDGVSAVYQRTLYKLNELE